MTYESIIARTSRQRLVTVAPHLRLLPPPETPFEQCTDLDVIEWAKQRARRGIRFGTAASQSATAPAERRTRQPDHNLKSKIFAEILAAAPATIDQLVAVTGRSKALVYWRLGQMVEEGIIHPVRPPGRHAKLMWTPSQEVAS